MSDQTSIPVAKLVTAWAGAGVANFLHKVGITSWGEAAAAAAAVYSGLLIIEWSCKKIARFVRFVRERRSEGGPP